MSGKTPAMTKIATRLTDPASPANLTGSAQPGKFGKSDIVRAGRCGIDAAAGRCAVCAKLLNGKFN